MHLSLFLFSVTRVGNWVLEFISFVDLNVPVIPWWGLSAVYYLATDWIQWAAYFCKLFTGSLEFHKTRRQITGIYSLSSFYINFLMSKWLSCFKRDTRHVTGLFWRSWSFFALYLRAEMLTFWSWNRIYLGCGPVMKSERKTTSERSFQITL